MADMHLRSTLPDEHLEERSKSTITASIGLVAPMTALVLELGSPFEGIVKVSGEPMRHALTLMNR
jgi:hypothetical protein